MSGILQRQATDVADNIRKQCLFTGEDFIMEGTLSWDGIVGQTQDEFEAHEYAQFHELVVIDIEAPEEG